MPQGTGTVLLPTILPRKIQTLLEVDAESSTGQAGQASRKARHQGSLSPTEGPHTWLWFLRALAAAHSREPGTPGCQGLLLPASGRHGPGTGGACPQGFLQKVCSCPPSQEDMAQKAGHPPAWSELRGQP